MLRSYTNRGLKYLFVFREFFCESIPVFAMKSQLTGGHLRSGQHFKVTFLPYYSTQETGCDIILNLVQNDIDLSNITAIIQNERVLSNNTWTFARLEVRQIIKILQKLGRSSPICVDDSYFPCLLWAGILAKACFYARPTVDALEEANSSRERDLRGEPWPITPFLDFGFVETGVFLWKTSTPNGECCRKHIIIH